MGKKKNENEFTTEYNEASEENLAKLIVDCLADPDNLCDNFILAKIKDDIVGVMVRPGKQSMFTIFDEKRLEGLVHTLEFLGVIKHERK